MSDNEIEVFQVGIRSLDELVEAFGIDTDTWAAHEPSYNSWPTTMKGDDGRPLSVINHQTSCKFYRKEPTPLSPIIHPIKIQSRKDQWANKGKPIRDYKVGVFLSDAHFGFNRNEYTGRLETPYHDRRALDAALQLVGYIDPDVVVFGGDWLDLPQFGKYDQFMHYAGTFQAALIECAWWLSKFVEYSQNAKHYYLEGNHDKRFRDDMNRTLPHALNIKPVGSLEIDYPMNSVPFVLDLHNLGIEYVGNYPHGEVQLNPMFSCGHGVKIDAKTGGTVRKLLEAHPYSFVQGHGHNSEVGTKTVRIRGKRREITAAMSGCLCHLDGRVAGSSPNGNWQNGVTVFEYGREWEQITPVRILEGNAMYHGSRYKARSRDKEIDTMLAAALEAAGMG